MIYDVKKCTHLAFGVILLGALSGCTDRVSMAEAEMKQIRELPAQPIEPPPTPQPIEDYDYVANNMRSPFVPQSLLDRQATIANMPSIRPDNNRIKHELEKYTLSSLIYRGKVVAPNGREYGLVQAPDGVVRDVQIGDYMGEDHGRIVEITPTQINLIEIVEDARLGYVERSANLITPN
ncbi:pilus assembly protein PilP [Moraxella oblonga]|uniref:pilus assembly protein PilP n=1 Tax=Moraxella oblonga TaxID=200413 RepID=UPI000833754E|nr:pilus assembly protein PilP [Moraxella oblonga]